MVGVLLLLLFPDARQTKEVWGLESSDVIWLPRMIAPGVLHTALLSKAAHTAGEYQS
jgi:hypothetical protein